MTDKTAEETAATAEAPETEEAEAATMTLLTAEQVAERLGISTRRLRGLWRVVLCLDVDAAGQSSAPSIRRMARTAGCMVEQLRVDDLAGAKDVAEYWQAHHALPAVLRAWAAQDNTALDAELIADSAMRNDATSIAARLAGLRVRWDGGEQTAQLRGLIADWRAIRAARQALEAK